LKFGKMGNFNMKRRRWRGPALGGPLQRGARYCFAAFDGEATTAQLTEWCRPEIVHAGGKPTAFQMVNQCTALRSIGARRAAHQPLSNEVTEIEPEIQNALTRLINLPADEDGDFAPRTVDLSPEALSAFETFRAFLAQTKAELDGREREWVAKGGTKCPETEWHAGLPGLGHARWHRAADH
jgi:hypothetical protein